MSDCNALDVRRIWTVDVSGAEKSDRSDAIIGALSGMGGWGTENELQIDFSNAVFFADGSTPRLQVVGWIR